MSDRKSHLTTRDIAALNHACTLIREGLGGMIVGPYLVGSSTERADYRDVDVRAILPDEDFDALFAGRDFFWSLFCFLAADWLQRQTGLPIDFQVQRMTEANEKFGDRPRNAMGAQARPYAGGGDWR